MGPGPSASGGAGGLRVTIRVRPGSSRTAVGGRYEDALVVRVTARPVDGAANEAVLVAVADAFGVRPRAVRLVGGTTGRTKVLHIDGSTPELAARLAVLCAT